MIPLDKILFDPSPNFSKGRGGHKVQYICLHSMSGFYSGSQAWFKNPRAKVSSHYLISQKGEILKMVQEIDTCWAIYGFNNISISIEHEDKQLAGKDGTWVTPEMFEASTNLVTQLLKKYNLKVENVIGHNDKMVQDYARKHNPSMLHVDPQNFPWVEYRSAVQEKLDGIH